MSFLVATRDDDDSSPAVDIVWQRRPGEWVIVWSTVFPTVEDRDVVYAEMRDRQSRWTNWGNLAMFGGAKALNEQLLMEWDLPPTP